MTAKTKEKEPIRVPEEDQVNKPLAGVFEITKKKDIKFRDGRVTFEAITPSVEEDDTYAGWSVRTNANPDTKFEGHYAGDLMFDHNTRKFFHYGVRQPHLEGGSSADKIGASPSFEQAVKNLLKMRYPDDFKVATSFE